MKHVYIAQLLCPERHCLLAAAGEIEEEAGESRAAIAGLGDKLILAMNESLRSGQLQPHCALCDAPLGVMKIEIGRTPFSTLEEAQPHLDMEETMQQLTARFLTAKDGNPAGFREAAEKARKARFN